MSNVVRLVNGGSIQVRTGVIQGIGPQGPMGIQGTQGLQGEQGPIGEAGPMGQILKKACRFDLLTNQPLTANTDTQLAFGSVPYDELAAHQSDTNFVLAEDGDYQVSIWVRFDDAAATSRELWFSVGSTLIARSSRVAFTGAAFYVDLSYPYRATAGQVINVYARSGTATAISLGGYTMTRMGSGPQGAVGPTGATGATGPTGPQGAAGPSGTASSGFTTYAGLLPH